jgi:tetratricopeptide (TPR) repeat protein
MKRVILPIVLTLFFLNKSVACLNGETRLLKADIFLYEDRQGKVPYGHLFNDRVHLEEAIHQLDSLYKVTRDLDYLSDKGLLLIVLERYDDAVKLYLQIEKLQANRYSTASNIGTAYELLGQNEKALKWIRKSVEIDPTSHKNSEWIHAKILEAKIKGEQFYTTSFLLNTDFGSDKLPKSKMNKDQLQKMSEALYYQLNERVSFVQPKEKIVAQLLFDLGNIAFLLGNYQDALGDYEQAEKYGFEGTLMKQRKQEARNLSRSKQHQTTIHKKASFGTNAFWLSGAALLILGLVMLLKRRKRSIG